MTAIKSTLLGSLLVLTACTPRPSMDVPSTYHTNKGTTSTAPIATKTDKVVAAEESTTTVTSIEPNDTLTPFSKLVNKGVTAKKDTKSVTTLGAKNEKSSMTTADTAKYAATASASAISSWEISGAMAARSKNKGWNASLNWMQRGLGQYQIRLFGPLGSGTVLINKQGGIVTLKDGPKTASSTNAEDLLKKQTGIRLPVNNLYYWVRGLPAPGSVQGAKRDSTNHLMLLKQDGYLIEYGQYMRAGNVILPSHIKLQGNGVFIKLVIKRWRV